MDEDLELNRFVKSALESKPPFALSRANGVQTVPARGRGGLAASVRRPKFLPWLPPALLAASLAVVATFHLSSREEPSSVEDVIRLLSEAENVTLGENGFASSVDLLLAWQEAPIADRGIDRRGGVW